jgi:hypothetical protein
MTFIVARTVSMSILSFNPLTTVTFEESIVFSRKENKNLLSDGKLSH